MNGHQARGVAGGEGGEDCQLISHLGSPGGPEGKESACNAGDPGLIPGLGRTPGEGNGNQYSFFFLSTPVFVPGEFHGQRSLAGCTPWGHREWDTTEQLTL